MRQSRILTELIRRNEKKEKKKKEEEDIPENNGVHT